MIGANDFKNAEKFKKPKIVRLFVCNDWVYMQMGAKTHKSTYGLQSLPSGIFLIIFLYNLTTFSSSSGVLDDRRSRSINCMLASVIKSRYEF